MIHFLTDAIDEMDGQAGVDARLQTAQLLGALREAHVVSENLPAAVQAARRAIQLLQIREHPVDESAPLFAEWVSQNERLAMIQGALGKSDQASRQLDLIRQAISRLPAKSDIDPEQTDRWLAHVGYIESTLKSRQ